MSKTLAINENYKNIVEQMAKDILSVQPMPDDILVPLLQSAKSEADLIKEGYKPVSAFKLLWTK